MTERKLISKWREAGSWWEGEPPREFVQWRDEKGIKREKSRVLPRLNTPANSKPYEENHKEEASLRPRKTRDEKVSKACGYTQDLHPIVRNKPFVSTYCPLQLNSGYSFGRSVMLAKEIPRRAAAMGIGSACLADRFALIGAMEFHREAHENGVKPLIGATLDLEEGGDLILIARDKHGYQQLSQLITACHLEEPRLFPLANRTRLERYSRGLLVVTGGDNGVLSRLLLQGQFEKANETLAFLASLYGQENVFLGIERTFLPWGSMVEHHLLHLARLHRVLPVACNPMLHSTPEAFPAQDVALCAESLCTVEEIVGRKPLRHASQLAANERPLRSLNQERYFRAPSDMAGLFSDKPELLENTLRVVERCESNVMPARTKLPSHFGDPGSALHELVKCLARERHGTMAKGLKSRIDMELERITRMGYADHFLVAWDTCNWARKQGVSFSGRGSMVDSAVAYCLGMSRIDAYKHNLHFDRFMPEDGSKRPDIDIDFEAHRREDIRNYLTNKYGKEKVATVAAIGAYCVRGIVREVGKALELPQEAISFLAKRLHGGVSPEHLEEALAKKPELRGSNIPRERLHWLFKLAEALADVPRNMRAHSSGVVISDRPIAETVPVMHSASETDTDPDGASPCLRIIQWDKRSAKHVFDKFDVLCLRGHDVLSGAEERIKVHEPNFRSEDVPADCVENYRTMRSGELIGIPQSASPAMRQAHMRLETRDLHDASLVQAGIRPGVGGAVKINELIARRRGLKPYTFDHPDLEAILGHSYGIVVFQEQIDQLLQVFCGYSSGEAEDIRDEIHKRRREDYGESLKHVLISRAMEKGYSADVANQVYKYVAEFKGYGFAQGHALAFAEISLRSIYLQQNYPAPYFAALLDAQPAGYYGPCTIVNEARSRGVSILPPCINRSHMKWLVEDTISAIRDTPELVRRAHTKARQTISPTIKLTVPSSAIRAPLVSVHGLSAKVAEKIALEVTKRPFSSLYDLCVRVKPSRDELESLILCGACDSICANRRALLWAVVPTLDASRTQKGKLDLGGIEPTIDLSVEDFSDAEKSIRERAILGVDITRHLMAFERERVADRGGITASEAKRMEPNRKAIVVGNPIRLRFPPTPSGKRVVFFDLEDETGLLNVTCFDRVYQKDGHSIVCSPYVTIIGRSQWRDGHTAFLAERVFPYNPLITTLADTTQLPITTSDFLVG
ncbi:MAG: DNA polymerase III subunit alpha [Fimbriimonadaceae bacterium]|nr:DNA polymerase III subunit alpha [Fimbriimonadaceae bacterium]QYK55672.1 MAG: DNA polymerase III subunit alpha [Fimbriimonadaceae bacterium]